MDINRNVVIILNCICTGFIFYIFYIEGLPNTNIEYFLYILLLTPILNIYYLLHQTSNTEGLISLWVKLKKKNIKDELEK